MKGRLIEREALTQAQVWEMHRLFSLHFQDARFEHFVADLDQKNWVVLLEDGRCRIQGFSTLLVYDTQIEGESATVVCSGDTIVARPAWGSSALARTWVTSVYQIARSRPCRRLYWLLIASGFRTYRFLPVFCKLFYPRYDRPTPPQMQRLMDALATERFGARFDARTGIVRFESPTPLSEPLCSLPASRLRDPHVAYFARLNPGFGNGDELVCLADLAEENLTPAGRRMVCAGRQHRVPEAQPA